MKNHNKIIQKIKENGGTLEWRGCKIQGYNDGSFTVKKTFRQMKNRTRGGTAIYFSEHDSFDFEEDIVTPQYSREELQTFLSDLSELLDEEGEEETDWGKCKPCGCEDNGKHHCELTFATRKELEEVKERIEKLENKSHYNDLSIKAHSEGMRGVTKALQDALGE